MPGWYDVGMKQALIFLLILILAAAGYAYFADIVEAPIGTPEDRRIMSVEEYVRQNISTLSPERAVLGGTFYVTKVQASDGRGTVWYEDGHAALVANFTYIVDKYGISISSFEVRDE